MRIPFKSESDAFRVALALGVLAGAAIVVGVLASRAYGVVLFAAGIAAGVTFELAGRPRRGAAGGDVGARSARAEWRGAPRSRRGG